MSDIKFEIVEEFGQFGNGMYSPELNKVKWNDSEPKWDIRKWSEDGKTPFKGVALDDSEASQLVSLIETALETKKNSKPIQEVSLGRATAKILNVFGKLSESGKMTKQLLYVNWGKKPKYYLRSWSEDYQKCGKGLTLDEAECKKLYDLLTAELSQCINKKSATPKGISVDLDDDLFI